ncbi:MAG: HEAT repeat domain-containing protein [Candidatus Brocadiaceae baterium WH-1]|nr:MAG: HEAT repeat domain-containing protein [Candidatus Jettenia sp. AMX2]
MKELKNKPQVRGLAQNPLLLSLLCSLYQEKEITLPAQRCKIYEKAVTYLLEKWTRNRNPQPDAYIYAKISLLERLAYDFTCEEKEIFTVGEIANKISGYKKLDEFSDEFRDTKPSALITELSESDGILQKLEREGDRYLFLHRTFQEYLTASYINRVIEKKREEGIGRAKRHFWDYEWHETLSLLAGMMRDPGALIRALMEEKDDIFSTLPLLAGRCIAECTECNVPDDQLIHGIIDRIYGLWMKYPGLGFIQTCVVSLGQSRDHMIKQLQKALKDGDSDVRGRAVWALEKIGDARAVGALIQALKDGDCNVRGRAVWALEKIGGDRAVDALIEALKDKDSIVRERAAEALGEIGDARAVDALIEALKDGDCNVRESCGGVKEDR